MTQIQLFNQLRTLLKLRQLKQTLWPRLTTLFGNFPKSVVKRGQSILCNSCIISSYHIHEQITYRDRLLFILDEQNTTTIFISHKQYTQCKQVESSNAKTGYQSQHPKLTQWQTNR